MSKHTPGPWKVERDTFHYGSFSTVVSSEKSNKFPGYQMIVEVGGFAGVDEQEANARLIASAPELLEALKGMLARFEITQDLKLYRKDDPCNKAVEAIAKAEGTL